MDVFQFSNKARPTQEDWEAVWTYDNSDKNNAWFNEITFLVIEALNRAVFEKELISVAAEPVQGYGYRAQAAQRKFADDIDWSYAGECGVDHEFGLIFNVSLNGIH